ncbi:GAF domain-containing sensor histidine kinase [Fischerella sp. JS2]|uniref:GAF domain-containing sensor histidine kinase n=1 Tax=Fischerella sp. JS2 TaxID=2597771 RepID=UPI0028E7B196|nr:GAF domain-containing sensor histidine kinase [Fischerella sp. JS2]
MNINPSESTAEFTQAACHKFQIGKDLEDGSNPNQILSAIAQRICQSFDLNTILNFTVTESRRFLLSDRVLIYRLNSHGSGTIVAESTIVPGKPLLGMKITDTCFSAKHAERYKRGCIQIIEDIYAAGLHPCQIDFLSSLQIRANLVVPILCQQDLWGLLIAQHCCESRQWQQVEIDLLKQLATQLSIAIQQAQLHQRVQYLQTEMKLQHKCLVQNITEQIRDYIDTEKILATAIAELAKVLQVERCHIELYDNSQTFTTVAHEYTIIPPVYQGMKRWVRDFPELYHSLLQKQSLQFSEVLRDWNPNLVVVTQLACPIFDAEIVMGNIWLTKVTQELFAEWEIKLVQQVANQCAIAIRQARLYQLAQTQVNQLEKLENLKHEFLRSLSHELRTPITSISLAVQTLEAIIKQETVFNTDIVSQLLQILQNECQRESKLINDLLSLTYLEAEADILTVITIDLNSWLPPIVESFREVTICQQQQLFLHLAAELPLLETDITHLEHIVTELLSNACKYTPAGESITVTASATEQTVEISISNSGVEIATNELVRIFDPFYRLPQHNPWQYGGTGLGLALVQKLVKHLKGSIRVESTAASTTFILVLPRVIAM